jgi:hypothetical protein
VGFLKAFVVDTKGPISAKFLANQYFYFINVSELWENLRTVQLNVCFSSIVSGHNQIQEDYELCW